MTEHRGSGTKPGRRMSRDSPTGDTARAARGGRTSAPTARSCPRRSPRARSRRRQKLDIPTHRRKYRRVNAAEQLGQREPEPLTWAEICARYPDQFVCLVDVVPIEPRSPEIHTAQIVGYGPTRRAAFDPIRNTRKYSRWSVVFTGECTK